MEYKDFQKEAIKKVVGGYERKENNRFLVADEVGLGKTIIAKGTIRCLMYFNYLSKGCPKEYEYNVLYLCSNLNIAEQNKSKLGIAETEKVSLMKEVILGEKDFCSYKGNSMVAGSSVENRTSMLLKRMLDKAGSKTIHGIKVSDLRKECVEIFGEEYVKTEEDKFKVVAVLENDKKNEKRIGLNIIPITPDTSVKINGAGHVEERRFIIKIIKDMKTFTNIAKDNELLNDFAAKFKDVKERYFDVVGLADKEELEKFIGSIYSGKTKETSRDGDYYKKNWKVLRQLFALASADLLQYDFVIMDEFQNFSDILHKANQTQDKKRNYKDKARYIASILDTGNFEAFSNKIREEYSIEKTEELSEVDRKFWSSILETKMQNIQNQNIEELITWFMEFAKEQVKTENKSEEIVNADERHQALQLVCNILKREKLFDVEQQYFEIVQENDRGIDQYKEIIIGKGTEEEKTISVEDYFLESAKKHNYLVPWWEYETFMRGYQEVRGSGWSTPINKVPFRYLLYIHFCLKNQGEQSNLSQILLNCFIHFEKNQHKKILLWQYAYLLLELLKDDESKLKYSVEQLEPMRRLLGDYFVNREQNYVDFDKKCENIIIEKIFNEEIKLRENKEIIYTKIMMLSATPFKMYIDDKDSEVNNVNIVEVCDFLSTNVGDRLGTSLREYKYKLLDFAKQNCKEVKEVHEKKSAFQDNMNKVFTRMERYAVMRNMSENWFGEVIGKSEDELVCGKIPALFDYLKQARNVSRQGSIITYVEDAPYMATFMHSSMKDDNINDGYKWKKEFDSKVEASEVEWSEQSYLYISKEDYDKKKNALGLWHGVYNNCLCKMLDLDVIAENQENHPGAARLLWIPPCVSQGTLKGVFEVHKDYGKTIVFSRLVQVPRMIAGLTSYEILRRLTWQIEQDSCRKDINRVWFAVRKNVNEVSNCYKSTYEQLDAILEATKSDIKKVLLDRQREKKSIWWICYNAILKYCHRYCEKNGKYHLQPDKIEILATSLASDLIDNVILNKNMGMFAIWASNGFYRPKPSVNNIVEQFIEDCIEKILAYCKDGCLNDVLDEWLYICLDAEQDLGEFLGVKFINNSVNSLSFIKATQITVSLYEEQNGKVQERKIVKENGQESNKKNEQRMKMNTYFARCIGMSGDDDKISSIKGLQQSFNSPFAPFVFATTSMGQEGLDFHHYADKIIHWRLPANPVDFEQREGRINRYHSLALRKRLIEWYGNTDNRCHDDQKDAYELFEDAFNNARKQLIDNTILNEQTKLVHCGMVPDWVLMNKNRTKNASIKRYVPYYYLSKTNEDYHKNLMVLQLYRSVIGQAKPDEVMERLMSNCDINEVKELFVDFSPYNK